MNGGLSKKLWYYSEILTMDNENPIFENIKLRVDSIGKKREVVLPILLEEQAITWFLFKENIREEIEKGEGKVDFAEIGAGSAIFSLLVAKHFKVRKVVGIERERSIAKRALENVKNNNLESKIEIKTESYSLASLPLHSVKIIFLNPPYHLYPPELEFFIPSHAKGGSYGMEEFYSQLIKASFHLDRRGAIVFHKMEVGGEEGPNFLNVFKKIFPGCKVLYYEIFPPIPTAQFLEKIYESKYKNWVNQLASNFPFLYFTSGAIYLNGKKAEIKKMPLPEELEDIRELRSWEDRISLHQKISAKALNQEGLNARV